MAGGGELLSTAHAARFNENDISADRRPDQADRDARLLYALVDFLFRAELRHAEEFTNDFRSDDHLLGFVFSDAARLLPRDGADFALQTANTGFAREAVNDLLQSGVGEFELFADFQAVLGRLLRDQVFVRDMQLFLAGVARQFDDLHTVTQRLGNRIHPVGRRDERDLGKIKGNVQVVIAER